MNVPWVLRSHFVLLPRFIWSCSFDISTIVCFPSRSSKFFSVRKKLMGMQTLSCRSKADSIEYLWIDSDSLVGTFVILQSCPSRTFINWGAAFQWWYKGLLWSDIEKCRKSRCILVMWNLFTRFLFSYFLNWVFLEVWFYGRSLLNVVPCLTLLESSWVGRLWLSLLCSNLGGWWG